MLNPMDQTIDAGIMPPRTLRVVPTTDNHVDLAYVRYTAAVGARPSWKRLDQLHRMVDGTNELHAERVCESRVAVTAGPGY